MRRFLVLLFGLIAFGFSQASRPAADPATYVASTPCDLIPRAMLSIPASIDCEFIKWKLVLQIDAATKTPTTFTLDYTYGMTQPNTTGFANGGSSGQKTGTWRIRPDAQQRPVYQLEAASPDGIITLVSLDNKLLHLLDPQGRLMIGHGSWSYTLNKL